MTLAEKIVSSRVKKGLTQEGLAENSGISLRTIQRIEKGDTIPRGHTLKSISATLEIPIQDLVGEPVSERIESINDISNENSDAYLQILNLCGILAAPVNILLSWILLRKKKHNKLIQETGRRMITFQVIWTILMVFGMMIALIFQMILAIAFSIHSIPLILIIFFVMYLYNLWIILSSALKLYRGYYDVYRFSFIFVINTRK